MSTTEPIRDKNKVRELIDYYKHRDEPRNYVLVALSVHSALRICDILRITWDDVYDFDNRRIRESITVTERKTGKSKTIALNAEIITAIRLYITAAARSAPLIINKRTGKAISRVQAYRLIRDAADTLRFRERVSCHSLRKTFGYHAWKNGISPAVIMEIYNHSSFAVTRRYLGVTQDDKNEVYLGLRFVE